MVLIHILESVMKEFTGNGTICTAGNYITDN